MVTANPFAEAIEAAAALRRQVASVAWKRRQALGHLRLSDLLVAQLEELNLKGVRAVPKPLRLQVKRLASICEEAERPLRWGKVQEALDDVFEMQVTLMRRCYKINGHYASLVNREREVEEDGEMTEDLATLDAEEEAR
jgi:hypothetical protein